MHKLQRQAPPTQSHAKGWEQIVTVPNPWSKGSRNIQKESWPAPWRCRQYLPKALSLLLHTSVWYFSPPQSQKHQMPNVDDNRKFNSAALNFNSSAEQFHFAQLTVLPVLSSLTIGKPWKPDNIHFYLEIDFVLHRSAAGICWLGNTVSVSLKDDVKVCLQPLWCTQNNFSAQKISHEKSFYTVLLHQTGQKLLSCDSDMQVCWCWSGKPKNICLWALLSAKSVPCHSVAGEQDADAVLGEIIYLRGRLAC